MKIYDDIKHVSSDISKKFENDLRNAINEFQDNGYSVEIQQGFSHKTFSAVVLAYRIVGVK